MKSWIVLFCCLLFVGKTSLTYALPVKCLQSFERKNACPHIIYKQAALAVSVLGIEKGDVICICLSDFEALINPSTNAIELIDQKVTMHRLAGKYQLNEKDMLTLIRN